MLTLPRAIHLLIEERAKVVAHARVVYCSLTCRNLANNPQRRIA